jgi:hypothetical protein
MGSVPPLSTGVIHFDLDQSSPRSRADFIMSQITIPNYVSDLLNAEAAAHRIMAPTNSAHEGAVNFVPQGGDVDAITLQDIQHTTEDLVFKPGVPTELLTGDDRWSKLLNKTSIYPTVFATTVFATNLSVKECTPVCQNLMAHRIGRGPIYLGLSTVESYDSILYNPLSAIDRLRENQVRLRG